MLRRWRTQPPCRRYRCVIGAHVAALTGKRRSRDGGFFTLIAANNIMAEAMAVTIDTEQSGFEMDILVCLPFFSSLIANVEV